MKNSHTHIIGIDEAGRGPLAGPVVVAGVRLELRTKGLELRGIRDSKKLSAIQREKWYKILTNHPKIEWATAALSPKVIDRINISRAADLGVHRVYLKLDKVTPRQSSEHKDNIVRASLSRAQSREEHTLLDAGLKLPPHIPHKAIIKGDEKIHVISAASIIAKVTRDRIMARLHKKYPKYGFDAHKGYGTKMHLRLIKRFGQCEIHRVSFRC